MARAAEPAGLAVDAEQLGVVARDVAALPADQRAALALVDLTSLSATEIARAMGVDRGELDALMVAACSSLVDPRIAEGPSCRPVRERLAAAAVRGTPGLRLPSLHLRRCAPCRTYELALRARRRQVSVLLAVPLPDGLRDAALGVMGMGAGAAPGAARRRRFAAPAGEPGWLAVGGGTVAVVTVLGAIGIGTGGEVRNAVEHATRPGTAQASTGTDLRAVATATTRPVGRHVPGTQARPPATALAAFPVETASATPTPAPTPTPTTAAKRPPKVPRAASPAPTSDPGRTGPAARSTRPPGRPHRSRRRGARPPPPLGRPPRRRRTARRPRRPRLRRLARPPPRRSRIRPRRPRRRRRRRLSRPRRRNRPRRRSRSRPGPSPSRRSRRSRRSPSSASARGSRAPSPPRAPA